MGIHPLVCFASSSHDLAATFPIHRLADMKGKKVRTVESPVTLRTWKALGANPTPIPSQEVYLALQTRIVDSVDNAASSYVAFKRYEVARYFAKVGTAQYFEVIGFSSAWLQKLPKTFFNALLGTTADSADVFFGFMRQGEQDAVNMAQTLKFEIDTIEDRDAWVAATAAVRDEVGRSSPMAQQLIADIGRIS